jgi:hypothetical protein
VLCPADELCAAEAYSVQGRGRLLVTMLALHELAYLLLHRQRCIMPAT